MATVAMTSAISGLNSFQSAINYISDNVANSQTAGFKRIDANFSSFVSTSSQRFFDPGGVTARPTFINDLQGSIVQDASPTSIAIAGAGWFPVQDGTSSAGGLTGNSITQFTRRGDFTLDQNSFMVNGANKFLFARAVPRPTPAVPNPLPSSGPLSAVQINQSQLPALQDLDRHLCRQHSGECGGQHGLQRRHDHNHGCQRLGPAGLGDLVQPHDGRRHAAGRCGQCRDRYRGCSRFGRRHRAAVARGHHDADQFCQRFGEHRHRLHLRHDGGHECRPADGHDGRRLDQRRHVQRGPIPFRLPDGWC